MQAVLSKALTKAGGRECGGLLLGEHVGVDHFVVRSLTVQKPGAIASFVRSLSGVMSTVTLFCRANGCNFNKFNYLGEWHSHPLFSVQPSKQDHSTMLDLVTDEKVAANFVVLLIFRLGNHGLEGSAHTYLPNGTIHRSELELEKLE